MKPYIGESARLPRDVRKILDENMRRRDMRRLAEALERIVEVVSGDTEPESEPEPEPQLPTRTHNLKTRPVSFRAVWEGTKRAELRRNDRDFRVGDMLRLEEYDPHTGTYSCAWLECRITHIADEGVGLWEGYVMLSLGGTISRGFDAVA